MCDPPQFTKMKAPNEEEDEEEKEEEEEEGKVRITDKKAHIQTHWGARTRRAVHKQRPLMIYAAVHEEAALQGSTYVSIL